MNQKRTLVHVLDEVGIGGAEILLISTIRLLPEYHHVLVSLFEPQQELDDRIDLSGVEVHCLNIKGKLDWLRAIRSMRRIVRDSKPLLVHAHLQRAGFVAKLGTPKSVPLFYTLHTPYSLELFRSSKVAVPAERFTARPYHHLIGVSQYVIDDYKAVIPNSGTTDKLYNFVDDDFFVPNALKAYTAGTALHCVSVGNLKNSKNYPYTFAAFKALKHLPVTLDVYGTGPEGAALQALLDEQGITNITLKGSIRNVSEVLPQYDAYIMSSTYEGFGIGPLEAMAVGLPVLLSDIPIFREIIGDNGVLFSLEDPQALTKKLQAFYEGKIDWKDYSDRARRTAAAIAQSGVYKQHLLDIYAKYALFKVQKNIACMAKTLQTGDSTRVKKTFSAEEVNFYCRNISGDSNKVHSDPEVARAMGFDACIVPGIMVSSLFGGMLGSTLPGEGTIHLGQQTKFMKPVYVDEEVEAMLEITAIRSDKPIITLRTTVIKPNGEIAIEGEAVVKFSSPA